MDSPGHKPGPPARWCRRNLVIVRSRMAFRSAGYGRVEADKILPWKAQTMEGNRGFAPSGAPELSLGLGPNSAALEKAPVVEEFVPWSR